MANWKQGQGVYEQLISDFAEHITEACAFYTDNNKVIDYARMHIPEYIEALPVKKLVQIHEYLMYMTELKPDPRFPAYFYNGGDRVISVSRYLQKYIDLELSKQFA